MNQLQEQEVMGDRVRCLGRVVQVRWDITTSTYRPRRRVCTHVRCREALLGKSSSYVTKYSLRNLEFQSSRKVSGRGQCPVPSSPLCPLFRVPRPWRRDLVQLSTCTWSPRSPCIHGTRARSWGSAQSSSWRSTQQHITRSGSRVGRPIWGPSTLTLVSLDEESIW